MEFIKNWFEEAFAQSCLKKVSAAVDEKIEEFLDAALAGDTALVESLIAPAIDLDFVNLTLGWNPLHIAAQAGHELAVKALIDAGIHLEARDSYGFTALDLATVRGSVAVVEMLSRHSINVHGPNSRGRTALHLAAYMGMIPIVEALIRNGANFNSQTGRRVYSPLHVAAFAGHWDIGKVLVEVGADATARTVQSEGTPLLIAAQKIITTLYEC